MKKDLHIIYSLSGEGRGHASVALAFHKELTSRMPGLKIHYFCGGKAYDFLKDSHLNVTEIPYMGFVFQKGAVRPLATLWKNLSLLFSQRAFFRSLKKKIRDISPVLAICDFEFFIPRVIRDMDIPLIHFDHQGIITETRYPVPLRERLNWLVSFITIKMNTHSCVLHIITSFFIPPFEEKQRKKLFVGPIVRQEILNKPNIEQENFFLVYVMDTSFQWIINLLQKFPREHFIITGLSPSHEIQVKNIIFKEVDPDGFLNDMKRCKGIIATGGHTLMGEVLALGKPLFALYQPHQFEQFLNCYYLEKMGFGKAAKAKPGIEASIHHFLEHIEDYSQNIRKDFTPGNEKAAEAVINVLKEIENP